MTRFKYSPIALFSMILGMAGTTIAFSRFEEILHPNIRISSYLLPFTSILFLLLTFIHYRYSFITPSRKYYPYFLLPASSACSLLSES
ncbi:MAG: hypothetical protein IMW85_06570 [Thermicanus sp.]|nr:hypothetical protein [Thermicanus sp.]